MPSPVYTKLYQTIASYVPEEKVQGMLARQLASRKSTPDSMTADDLRAMLTSVTGAATLYIPDKDRRDELCAKLKTLA